MTEQEYLSRLERALKDAPEDDLNEALAFYHGYFEDGGIPTDSPEEAADRLLHDGKPTVPGKKKTTFGWKLTVIILTFPFWIGILAAWFALLVTAWVVLAVFPIALAAGSIGSLIGGIGYFSIYYPIGLQGIGWALAGGGLTMLCWKPCLLAIIGLWNVHKLLWQKFRHWMKKEVAYETVQ